MEVNLINRVYNFCPGPCMLPLEVLEETQHELGEYKNSGMSLIECSHRGPQYDEVHNEAVEMIKELLRVPDDFAILFIQGGATLQFAMTAMNLLAPSQKAAYINSGHWATLAINDARVYGDIDIVWDGKDEKFARSPATGEIEVQDGCRYLHVTTNETIGGVRLYEWPEVDVPLVGDMSSDYMSRQIPWDRFDATYGGAQKNLGPSGVALVIVRKSVLESSPRELPAYLDYRVHAKSNSLFNTPPVFPIYVIGKVLKWIKRNGGVDAMASSAVAKSGHLYNAIDTSGGFYDGPVKGDSRSVMNVVFRLPNEGLESKFLADAEKEGMVNLTGHRSVGGIRASIYNAMPMEGAEKLADFMNSFRSSHS